MGAPAAAGADGAVAVVAAFVPQVLPVWCALEVGLVVLAEVLIVSATAAPPLEWRGVL
eukprot:CAMPEP_0172595100 /NCGR_PEP_ID=MMETSP1068-20121228/14656_1 /TAXON_ID=35684 /ORGANISM="Pseudopedinella elastica, Strain CCMP716" /LENGTH=57 /DNA_ID=CAMNT_0013393483 /DNA_START=69 /DNA_END=238 /DNA_ORIENTATION=-